MKTVMGVKYLLLSATIFSLRKLLYNSIRIKIKISPAGPDKDLLVGMT